MKIRLIVLLLIMTASLRGYSQSLAGTKWKLTTIHENNTPNRWEVGPETTITLAFNADSVFSGKACNMFKGKYENNKGGEVTMHHAMRTKKGCSDMRGRSEDVLFSYFFTTRPSAYILKEESLELSSNKFTLVFKLLK